MRECLYATSSRKDADLVVVPLDLSSGVGALGRDDDRFLPLLLFFTGDISDVSPVFWGSSTPSMSITAAISSSLSSSRVLGVSALSNTALFRFLGVIVAALSLISSVFLFASSILFLSSSSSAAFFCRAALLFSAFFNRSSSI